MNCKVDLVLFNSTNNSTYWNLGDVYHISIEKKNFEISVSKIMMSTKSDYVLFWDKNFTLPNVENIQELCKRNYDVFHGSYWNNDQMEPRYIDFVKPIWIYNLQAESSIEFSSFRSTHRNTLIKTKTYKDFTGFLNQFNTVAFEFLEFGYRVLKQGGIIRYSPILNPDKTVIDEDLSSKDNELFINIHFTKKWSYYARFRSFFFREKKVIIPQFKKSDSSINKAESQKINSSIHSIENISISILAPTLDRYWYVQNTINQLQNQRLKPIEILITDQTDLRKRKKLEIENLEVPVRYFVQDKKGQVVAWNKLIKESKGNYLLFLGDDADNIYPDFCYDLAKSLIDKNSDMMASRVVEKGISYNEIPSGIKMSDTFPITLIKKEVVVDAGCYNMFFNKGIRADADLAIRCHLKGALLLINNSVEIFHHRAPSGGLRAHKQRRTTFYMSQHNIRDYTIQTETEYYISYKYFSKKQIRESNFIKNITLFTVKGNAFKKILKMGYILFNLHAIKKKIRTHKNNALKELATKF